MLSSSSAPWAAHAERPLKRLGSAVRTNHGQKSLQIWRFVVARGRPSPPLTRAVTPEVTGNPSTSLYVLARVRDGVGAIVSFDDRLGQRQVNQGFVKPPEGVRSGIRSTMRLCERSREHARASPSTFNPKVAGSIPARPIDTTVLQFKSFRLHEWQRKGVKSIQGQHRLTHSDRVRSKVLPTPCRTGAATRRSARAARASQSAARAHKRPRRRPRSRTSRSSDTRASSDPGHAP